MQRYAIQRYAPFGVVMSLMASCTMPNPAFDNDEAGTTTRSDANDEIDGDGDGDSGESSSGDTTAGDGDGDGATTETGDTGMDMMVGCDTFVTATQVSNDLGYDCKTLFGADLCAEDTPPLKRGELLNGIALFAWDSGQLQGYVPISEFAFADVINANHWAWNGTQVGAWLHLPLPPNGDAFFPDDLATCDWWDTLLPVVLELSKPYAIIEYASPNEGKSKSDPPFHAVSYKVCGATLNALDATLTGFAMTNNLAGNYTMPVDQPGVLVVTTLRDLGANGLPEMPLQQPLLNGAALFEGFEFWDNNGAFYPPPQPPFTEQPPPLCFSLELQLSLTDLAVEGQSIRVGLNPNTLQLRGVTSTEPVFEIAP